MKHKCDGCKYKGEHQKIGVCYKEHSLIEAAKAYKADKCPFAKPMTNFEFIKSLSVEEMAEMLYEEKESTMCYCDFCEHYKHHAPHCSAPDIQQGCLNAIKKYLESEVQEE